MRASLTISFISEVTTCVRSTAHEEHQPSGKRSLCNSGTAACQHQRSASKKSISYPSFCNWRRRCAETMPPAAGVAESAAARQADITNDSPTFIDLGSLATAQTPATAVGWNITLRLGNGVELQLSQAQ